MAILHQFDGDRGERQALAAERSTGTSTPHHAMTTMNDETPMPFGVHKGKKMKHIPADYLLWIWDQGPCLHRQNGGVADYIRARFTVLEAECPDVIIKNRPDVPRTKN